MPSIEQKIFQNRSTTYYFSSRFFPPEVRNDVSRFYSFVRVADDYVDELPQNKRAFHALRLAWDHTKRNPKFNTTPSQNDTTNERVIKNIVHLSGKYGFDKRWVESFMDAMQSDLNDIHYARISDSLDYVYGSGEVIGLMMAKIMGLPGAALPYARMQGRSMQWFNFIRDLDEDNKLGRCYFPKQDLDRFKLQNLKIETAQAKPEQFASFVRFQLKRYYQWQGVAEKGFKYIPPKLLAPLQMAVNLYDQQAKEIENNPGVVFRTESKLPKLSTRA